MKTKTTRTKLIGTIIFVCLLGCSSAMARSTDLAQQVTGWRTDATGRHLYAEPPTEWSSETNVLWKTRMPNRSNSTPIVVGDRIFACSEPTTLVCVRATDGEILWQRTNTYLDTVSPEEVDKVRKQLEKVNIEKTTKEFRVAKNQLNNTKNQLNKAEKKLKESPTDQSLKQEIETLEKKMEDQKKRVDQLWAKLEPVKEYMIPVTHDVNGYSSCTPVSDGKNVYVLFGTGVAACYDMEGNRKWVKLIEKPTHGWGHSSSPVLVGDKLLVHVRSLIAVDKNTGEVIWKSKATSRWGTAACVRIGDANVIITPNGDFFRASDGKLIAKNVSFLEYATPIVYDGVVYFIQHGSKAFKLPLEAADTITPEFLWETKPRKERYYASSIYYGGLIYAVNQKGFLSVIDENTGKIVHEKKLKLGKGTVYPSVTLAGTYLFVSSDNGTTMVFESGPIPYEIAKNTLESFRSCPVFVGKRMYVRGMEHLYCIGE